MKASTAVKVSTKGGHSCEKASTKKRALCCESEHLKRQAPRTPTLTTEGKAPRTPTLTTEGKRKNLQRSRTAMQLTQGREQAKKVVKVAVRKLITMDKFDGAKTGKILEEAAMSNKLYSADDFVARALLERGETRYRDQLELIDKYSSALANFNCTGNPCPKEVWKNLVGDMKVYQPKRSAEKIFDDLKLVNRAAYDRSRTQLRGSIVKAEKKAARESDHQKSEHCCESEHQRWALA